MGRARAPARARGASAGAPRVGCLLLVAFVALLRPARAAFAGPYWMRVRALGNCPQEEVNYYDQSQCDMCVHSSFRHNRTMKSPVMDVNVTVSHGAFHRGESTMTLDIARWNSVSGWRDHFLVMSMGELCFVYEEIATDIVKVMAEMSGVPTRCPIPDGVYSGENARTQLMPLRKFPSLPYGRYRVHTVYGYARKRKGSHAGPRSCMKLVVDVVPKRASDGRGVSSIFY